MTRLRDNQRIYILDLKGYGSKLMFAIKNVFPYRTNHWASQNDYLLKVQCIYFELFTQIFQVMNFNSNEADYFLSLTSAPNYNTSAFDTIYQFSNNDDGSLTVLTNLVREIGVFLHGEIRSKVVPVVFDYEYIVDQAASTYIVLSVFHISSQT